MASLKQLCITLTMLVIVVSLIGCSLNSVDKDQSFLAVPVTDVVGRAVDATKLDLWTLRDIYYAKLFEGLPENCTVEIACPLNELKETTDFESTKDFKETFTSHFGLNLGVDWKGLGGKLNVGVDDKSTSTENDENRATWWKVSKVGKCAQLEMSCISNPNYFSPFARAVLKDFEQTGGADDDVTMQRFYDEFIQQFGSHLIKGVSHGAAIQASHTLDHNCKASERCRKIDVGFKFGFAKHTFEEIKELSLNLDFDVEQNKCVNEHSCLKDAKTKCATLGGGSGSMDMCGKEVPPGGLDSFMNPNDMIDSSSVVSMQLMPIELVLLLQGFSREVRNQVKQAVEWKTCEPPLGSWTRQEGGGHFCKCVRQCTDGGVLNERTCKCEKGVIGR